MDRLGPFFSRPRGKPPVDDLRVLSGIILIQRNGLMWKHAPAAYIPFEIITERRYPTNILLNTSYRSGVISPGRRRTRWVALLRDGARSRKLRRCRAALGDGNGESGETVSRLTR